MAHPRPTLADLVDLRERIEGDAEADPHELARRDRRVGRELDHLKDHPATQLAAWLHHLHDDDEADASQPVAAPPRSSSLEPRNRHAHWATRAQNLATLLLLVLGTLVGVSAAAAVFSYGGDHPVNVVWVLAVFVGLPLVLLAAWAVAALPQRWIRWMPAAVAAQEAVVLLSPGRLAGVVQRWLPQTQRERLAAVTGSAAAHGRQYGRVHQWAVLAASQALAGAVMAGAIATLLVLVVFSDLAFAWSTTLTVSAERFHGLTQAVAWPWAWALPSAVPSIEVVQKTQYYRLDPSRGGQASLDAAELGQWWTFLLMAMLTYGLLPRLFTYTISRGRLRSEVARAMVRTPGAERVLARLNGPLVETGGEGALGAVVDHEPPPPAQLLQRVGAGPVVVVNWSGVPVSDDAVKERVQEFAKCLGVLHAGGGRSLSEDERTVAGAAAALAEAGSGEGGPGAVLLLVKAWEPPLLEAMDFLRELREAVGNAVPLVVAPLAEREEGHSFEQQGSPGRSGLDPAESASQGVVQWRKRAKASGDPWLSVGRAW